MTYRDYVSKQRTAGRTYQEIGDKLGVSYQAIYQIYKPSRALKTYPDVFIYFIKPENQLGPIKIGSSSISPEKRLRQTVNWSPVALEVMGSARGTRSDEFFLHKHLSPYKSHREWFHPSPEVLSVVKTVIRFGMKYIYDNM